MTKPEKGRNNRKRDKETGTARAAGTEKATAKKRTETADLHAAARTGRIVKALSGYYYVAPDEPEPNEMLIQCRGRGIFKIRGESPLVGDRVIFGVTENGEGTVDEILQRETELIRPPVANADLAVLVFSVTEPALNLQLLDKFLVHIEHAEMDTVLCLSKEDLASSGGDRAAAEAIETVERIYRPIGYDVYVTSAVTGDGLEPLLDRIQGRLSLVAGQSGVGKSSLLNRLLPGLTLETNEISARLGRGKHTTRHVELMPLPHGGYIADTPGFSQLDFLELGIEELGFCFREFRPLSGDCKFRACTHVHEPGCAVIAAREDGRVAPSRYESYLHFMNEMKEKKRRY